MWIGSLRLPKPPASRSPSPPPAGCAPRAGARDASRTSATRSSSGRLRRTRILFDRRVHVLEQAHVLRTDVDLHAPPLHAECTSLHRHDAGRGDEVAGLVVGGLVGLELHVVEANGD